MKAVRKVKVLRDDVREGGKEKSQVQRFAACAVDVHCK